MNGYLEEMYQSAETDVSKLKAEIERLQAEIKHLQAQLKTITHSTRETITYLRDLERALIHGRT